MGDCTSSRNGGTGIVVMGSCTVIRCNASRNTNSPSTGINGITAGAGCTVADCTAGSNGYYGISVDFGSTVRNCTAQANGYGIQDTNRSQLTGNTYVCNINIVMVTFVG